MVSAPTRVAVGWPGKAAVITGADSGIVRAAGDIAEEQHCKNLVQQALRDFGRLGILVNNAAAGARSAGQRWRGR